MTQRTLTIILPTESKGETIPNWQGVHEEYIKRLTLQFRGVSLPTGLGNSQGTWVAVDGSIVWEYNTPIIIKTSQIDSDNWLTNIAKEIACSLKQEGVYIEIDSLASVVNDKGELTTL